MSKSDDWLYTRVMLQLLGATGTTRKGNLRNDYKYSLMFCKVFGMQW